MSKTSRSAWKNRTPQIPSVLRLVFDIAAFRDI